MTDAAAGTAARHEHRDVPAQPAREPHAILRHIDWIWHIRGSVALPPGQSSDDAFGRLDSLFHTAGTRHERSGNTLVFSKTDPAAQDKLSVFNQGVLTIESADIENTGTGPVLRYDLTSRALLYCCLAPLLFLAIAQATIGLGTLMKPTAEAAAKAEKTEKAAAAKKAAMPMNPIDKFLGAPAPEKPKKDGAKGKAGNKAKAGEKKDDKDDEKDEGPSPIPAYVFAGIFAALYGGGRLLEAWLVKTLFRKRLLAA